MTAYNFRPRFAALVQDGRKRQTIRKVRPHGNPVPGSMLQLYRGMRSPACQKLLPDQKCIEASKVWIEWGKVNINGCDLDPQYQAELAERDGFDHVIDFFSFFRDVHGLPFEGILIRWEYKP
jgi:hypothetical protein